MTAGDGPGWRLRDAREERNLSTLEIADALHLERRIVEALEADDYASLPPVTFTKGYLRAYARYVGLAEEQVLREFGSVGVREDRRPLTAAVGSESPSRRGGSALAAWILGAIVVIALAAGGAWFYWVRSGHALPFVDWVWSRVDVVTGQSAPQNATSPEDTAAGGVSSSGETQTATSKQPTASTGASGAVDRGGSVGGGSGESGEQTAPPADAAMAGPTASGGTPGTGGAAAPESAVGEDTGARKSRTPPTSGSGPGAMASGQAAAAPTGETPGTGAGVATADNGVGAAGEALPTPQLYEGMRDNRAASSELADTAASGDNASTGTSAEAASTSPRTGGGVPLTFDFSGESWMEVRDAHGERLLFGLITDDGTRTVRGEPPFDLVIGDVTHVSLKFKGRQVDLSKYSHDRVARFTLGKQ